MKITLLGAAGGEVTGSAYLIQTASANIMVDCGLFQGAQKLENFNRLPASSAENSGGRGAYARTPRSHGSSAALDAVRLHRTDLRNTRYGRACRSDSQGFGVPPAEDTKRQNRRLLAAGKPPIVPLYTKKEVERLESLYRRLRYDHPTPVASGISVRAVEAGHILESASLEITVEEDGRKKLLVFSGDLGPRGAPLHRDPVPFKQADLVFMESTYGDREHPSLAETAVLAREAVKDTIDQRGRVLVPTFAIGRSQLLLYMLAGAFKRKTLKPFPIFLDSPMAIRATSIYRSHEELFDDEAIAMRRSGELSAHLRTVKVCQRAGDSAALARKPGPLMVLAGAGMCTGGRIMHHLRNHLPDPTTDLLMMGYQSRGSVGRALADGTKEVRIAGQKVPVRARTHVLGGLSGHAGQSDLLNWLGSLASSRPRVILTDGEDGARSALRQRIQNRFGLHAEMPAYRETIEV